MNLDSLKGRWLQNDYSLLSLAKLVQNYCDMGNLSQMVDEPTRFMFNSVSKSVEVSCLDHVYTNSKYKCSKPTILPFGNSDHDLVTYTRYSKQNPTNNPTIRGRTYKKFNPSRFIEDLKTVNWGEVYQCFDLNETVQIFTKKLVHQDF